MMLLRLLATSEYYHSYYYYSMCKYMHKLYRVIAVLFGTVGCYSSACSTFGLIPAIQSTNCTVVI